MNITVELNEDEVNAIVTALAARKRQYTRSDLLDDLERDSMLGSVPRILDFIDALIEKLGGEPPEA